VPATDDTRQLTDQLADKYVTALDYISRVARGMETGDWYYVADKGQDLRAAIDQLVKAAIAADRAAPEPTAGAVMGQILRDGAKYRATGKLHPGADT
jgi:hypothetical protein